MERHVNFGLGGHSERVSEVVAHAIAGELRLRGLKEARPAPPGELDASGAERRMAGGLGAKKVDVTWATDEAGGAVPTSRRFSVSRKVTASFEPAASHTPTPYRGAVRKHVAKGSALLTDEDRSFAGLAPDYNHFAENHSAGEYVRMGGFVHTNLIESIWALLKRQIIGIHHWVSSKYLDRDVQEMTWRFNRRAVSLTPRMNCLFRCVEGRLTYKALIA